jgi:hypothetical protein
MPFQAFFAFDRVKALSSQHAEWKDKEPFASLLRGDTKGALAGGEHAWSNSLWPPRRNENRGVSEDCDGLDRHRKAPEPGATLYGDGLLADARTARLPACQRLQNLYHLGRRHRIHAPVGGAGLRIPPEQVVGSSIKTKFEQRDGPATEWTMKEQQKAQHDGAPDDEKFPTKKRTGKHIARSILVGLYTGTSRRNDGEPQEKHGSAARHHAQRRESKANAAPGDRGRKDSFTSPSCSHRFGCRRSIWRRRPCCRRPATP